MCGGRFFGSLILISTVVIFTLHAWTTGVLHMQQCWKMYTGLPTYDKVLEKRRAEPMFRLKFYVLSPFFLLEAKTVYLLFSFAFALATTVAAAASPSPSGSGCGFARSFTARGFQLGIGALASFWRLHLACHRRARCPLAVCGVREGARVRRRLQLPSDHCEQDEQDAHHHSSCEGGCRHVRWARHALVSCQGEARRAVVAATVRRGARTGAHVAAGAPFGFAARGALRRVREPVE